MTGGARIDLLGIPKDNLPAVWADLGKAGLVSATPTARASAR